jgi:multicopper oxidase
MGGMEGMDMVEDSASPSASPASGGMSMKFMLMDQRGRRHRVPGGARGHKLIVTHTDGFPVEHQQVDALLVGMGERYDALVTLGDGVFPLVALAEGKNATGMALVRTGSGSAPKATVRPKEHRVELTGGMDKYGWAINGKTYDMDDPAAPPLTIEEGQRVRLDFVNTTEMWHPMHLQGHTYQLGDDGPRKDTSIVLPKKKLSVIFDADNPGQWMLHCHNAYHGEVGMMALVAYQA